MNRPRPRPDAKPRELTPEAAAVWVCMIVLAAAAATSLGWACARRLFPPTPWEITGSAHPAPPPAPLTTTPAPGATP